MNELERKKLHWHSRRGMLELDLLLIPFVNRQLEFLDDRQLTLYQSLLRCEDQDIFAWLLLREIPSDPGIAEIVSLILEFAGKPD